MKNDILNKKQAARYMKISISTIDRLMEAKKIPYIKLKGRVLFLRESLLDWLKNGQTFITSDELDKALKIIHDYMTSKHDTDKKLPNEIKTALKIMDSYGKRALKNSRYIKKIAKNLCGIRRIKKIL